MKDPPTLISIGSETSLHPSAQHPVPGAPAGMRALPPKGRTRQPSLQEMQAHISLRKMNPFSRSIPSAEVNLLAGEGGAPLF